MKKAFLFLIGFLFVVSSGYTQDNKLGIGIELGPNLSSASGNEVADRVFKNGLGFFGGVNFQYGVTEKIIVKTCALFSLNRTVSEKILVTDISGTPYGNTKMVNRFYNIEFPVLVQYEIINNSNIFIGVGGFYASLIKAESDAKDEDIFPFPDLLPQETTSSYENGNYGITVSVGTTITLSDNKELSIVARNNFGLADISKDINLTGGETMTNGLGLAFGLTHFIGGNSK